MFFLGLKVGAAQKLVTLFSVVDSQSLFWEECLPIWKWEGKQTDKEGKRNKL